MLASNALLSLALVALATPRSVEDLARGSDAVVRGRVVQVATRWSADHRRILTDVTLEATSVWRGSAPARSRVVVPGGSLDGVTQRVDAAPSFAEGEDVVVFLGKVGALFRVEGLAMGKFAVSEGTARPDLSRLSFVRGRALRAGERAVAEMSVDELEARVRAAK